jgi:hypothetical protein
MNSLNVEFLEDIGEGAVAIASLRSDGLLS